MNIVLIDAQDMMGDHHARLTGRRAEHIRNILRAGPGEVLRVGWMGGGVGQGTVTALDGDSVEIDFETTAPPPPPSAVLLVLALPRPKCLRRLFQSVACMGVKRVVLLGAYRVEKSYWDSPWLAEDAVREQLILGLEQAGDTVLPVVSQYRLFRPFVEDVLPGMAKGMDRLLAHPCGVVDCPTGVTGPTCLVIGPEGGFIPYEVERFLEAGFRTVSLGPRPLRTEQAVAALLGRLA